MLHPSLTAFSSRITRSGAWIGVLGTFLLVGGLIWDAEVHTADPGLASHESVFTVDNPAHLVFLTGIALVVIGMFLFVLDRLRDQWATRHDHRPLAVAVVAVALALVATGGVAAAIQIQVAPGGDRGTAPSDHGPATAGGSPAPGHHPTFVTTGSGCAPVGTPPTTSQTAAATALVTAVKADWSPTITIADAAGLGYVPPRKPAASKVLSHLANPILTRSTSDLLDPARPRALVFAALPDGNQVLAGVLFTAPIGQGPCPGGATTLWHVHRPGATREMIHVWLFDNPAGAFSTGIGGKVGLLIAQRELERGTPAAPSVGPSGH